MISTIVVCVTSKASNQPAHTRSLIFRLNIFYSIRKQRDLTQVITTLDSPFPNVTTDFISYNWWIQECLQHTYTITRTIILQYRGITDAETILQRKRVDRHVNHSNLCESLTNSIATSASLICSVFKLIKRLFLWLVYRGHLKK